MWDFGDGGTGWYKNGIFHREDGPAFVNQQGFKTWDLEGEEIFSSTEKLDLTNKIVLSKEVHPEYPTVQVWKYIGQNGIREQIVIPGMEEYILE